MEKVYHYRDTQALAAITARILSKPLQRKVIPTTSAPTTTTLPSNTLPTTIPAACPARYSLYSESCGRFCYRYEDNDCKDWDNARAACQAEGGDLLAPSECNYEFLREQAVQNLGDCPGNLWLGARRPRNGDNFRTVRGDPISNTANFWERDEPNNVNGNENCLEMRIEFTIFLANDQICSEENGYICQIIR
ncbi:hypothetical protein ACJMK2_038908 [Sinanodonta woodiana]|uniref:C-type lectin domain-containing protein n=1 Tax=Sinanodonta woodiana TaxID=1069815 RepID=A0ABD3WAD5_SINWO